MSYCGYKIPELIFDALEKQYPPKYECVYGHHITEHLGKIREDDITRSREIVIESYVDHDGIEAFVVQVDRSNIRPDGKIYHITWSLDPERYRPVDSNELVINKKGEPIQILLFSASLEQF